MTKSRIDLIKEKHPHISEEDIRLMLCYFYKSEWCMPDVTAAEVADSLDCIVDSMISADADAASSFVKAAIKPYK